MAGDRLTMRVVVTGASGFIGRALCPALRNRGHEVIALDRAATGDLAGPLDWSMHIAGANAVVHLAALAHARGVDPQRLERINVRAAASLGQAAAAQGAMLLFMSTVKVLGEETGASPFDELSETAPLDPYGKAKAEAESALRGVAGLKLVVLRPPLVYGPGVKANFLLLLKAIARGWPLPLASVRNARSLLYVGNLADAVARCVEAPAAAGRSYLVSDGAPLSTPELCKRIGEALKRPAHLFSIPASLLELAPTVAKLTRSLVVDDSSIRRDLDWQPPCSLDHGLQLTAEWLRGGQR
jgi:nucleoside-diphosphate-sugar epimerase